MSENKSDNSQMRLLYDPRPHFSLSSKTLAYDNKITQAFNELSEIKGMEQFIPRYKKNSPVAGLNHYLSLLLAFKISTISKIYCDLPDSQQDEWALNQKLYDNGRGIWLWRSDIIAFNDGHEDVRKFLEGKSIRDSDYPVLIRHPGVGFDKDTGFKYSVTDRTILIKDAWFLNKNGKFKDDDPGLIEIGFPYDVGEEGNRSSEIKDEGFGLHAVYRDRNQEIKSGHPNRSKANGGVVLIEYLHQPLQDLEAQITAMVKIRKKANDLGILLQEADRLIKS